ncbi:MAG: septum formation inhibitor Maf [Lachnospiraceae bacterium]|nr:septum formation inhibitor Maf [Lachnospiraceae bacterium]
MAEIILASGSPRRRELLGVITDRFIVMPADADEETEIKDPGAMVAELSKRKAAAVAKDRKDCIVIGADTVVSIDGRVLGKPENEEDAFSMLRTLSGNTHQVFTGVTVVCNDESYTFTERTDVRFSHLTDDEIRAYIGTGEPMDKAGAYGIQHYGARFVEAVCGDYFTVVGLPVQRLYSLLKEHFPETVSW